MTGFTRTVQGQEAPVPGRYHIDPAHTRIGFSVKHMGLSKVRGTFSDFEGTITLGETEADTSAELTIQAASIDTGQSQRDEHLRSNDFLDMPNHPTLEFRSTKIEPAGDEWKVHGELTIRGATRPVTLEVEFEGAGPDVLGDQQQPRIGFSAETKINREDFGVNWNQALETGGWVVGKEVTIEMNVEAVRQ
ncbi:YceI family protein [Bounagaea algeriensis]